MVNSVKSCLHNLNPLPRISDPLRRKPEQVQKDRSDWNLHNYHPVKANQNNLEEKTIYDQYLDYYKQCNDDIYAIDQLPPEKRSQPNVVQDRATIVAQQAALGKIYQQDNAGKTLEQFIQDCAVAEATIAAAYNDAIGSGGTIYQQIQADYRSGQSITANIGSALTQDEAALNISSFQKTLTALEAQITALPEGDQKTKALADLNLATQACEKLQEDCKSAQVPLKTLQLALANLQVPFNGALAQLQLEANIVNPSQFNLDWANARLGDIKSVQATVQGFQSGTVMGAVATDTSLLQAAIQKVNQDLRPAPTPGQAENSCWDIDWTTHMAQGTSIPPGVTMVNLFVGKIDIDGSGAPIVGGFADLNSADIKAFAEKCSIQGVQVKISIGGGGGSYDNCWDVLTANNINAFAQMLVDFCHTNGLAGVDFDYEKYNSPTQQVLVGNLIRQFKTLDPTLQTTLCTNAGFGPQFQWPTIVQTIMDASCDPTTGECKLDRLNVMSYYDPVASEEGWLNGWADWTSKRYGFKPSQIGVGIDGFDGPHIGDMSYMAAMAQFAGQKGFSTGYWAYNPADAANSDKFCRAVYDNYNNSKTFFGRVWNAVKSAFRGIQAAISFMFNRSAIDKTSRNYVIMQEKIRRLTAKIENMKSALSAWDKTPIDKKPALSYTPIKDELHAKASAKQSGMMRPYQLNMQFMEATCAPTAPASSPVAPPKSSKNYLYEDYVNNWGGGVTPPPGVSGSQAFAVILSDGSFDSRYPVAGGGNTALAVGGWNNSQQGQGLYNVLTAPLNEDGSLNQTQQTLLNNLLNAAKTYGYNKILLDFEDYFDPNAFQVKEIYTKFLQVLGAQLHALGKQLDICTSPAVENQNYYDINRLLTSVDHYQVMTYDYAQGGSIVTGNASVSQSKTYLDAMLAQYPGLTQEMIMLGVPTYGIQFSIAGGMSPAQVKAGIEAGTLQGSINSNQPGTGSAEMANDTILQKIGNWTHPANGWVLITTNKTPTDYFYYNEAQGSVITAFPPASVKDFATLVKQNYPDVTGFFGWEASDESNGAIMKELINDTAAAPSLVSATTEVQNWLLGLKDKPSQDPTLKQWAGNLLAKLASPPATLQALAVVLNEAFNPSGVQDIYMQIPALLEVDGQAAPNAGNVINLLNELFTKNSDLISLQNYGLNIPTPTEADMTFAQVSFWVPQMETDYQVKPLILTTIGSAGSSYSHEDIKQLYWGTISWEYKMSAADSALLQELMYANTTLALGSCKILLSWQPTSDAVIAFKEKILTEILNRKNGFSESEWQEYREDIILKLSKDDAKCKMQSLLLGNKEIFHHHNNQGVKKD